MRNECIQTFNDNHTTMILNPVSLPQTRFPDKAMQHQSCCSCADAALALRREVPSSAALHTPTGGGKH